MKRRKLLVPLLAILVACLTLCNIRIAFAEESEYTFDEDSHFVSGKWDAQKGRVNTTVNSSGEEMIFMVKDRQPQQSRAYSEPIDITIDTKISFQIIDMGIGGGFSLSFMATDDDYPLSGYGDGFRILFKDTQTALVADTTVHSRAGDAATIGNGEYTIVDGTDYLTHTYSVRISDYNDTASTVKVYLDKDGTNVDAFTVNFDDLSAPFNPEACFLLLTPEIDQSVESSWGKPLKVLISEYLINGDSGDTVPTEAPTTVPTEAPTMTPEEVITDISYGDKQVQIKLVENFNDSVVSPWDYGICEIIDGDVILSEEYAASCVDRYGITAPMLKAAGKLTGAKYVVLSLTNKSDGEVWFCFQPDTPGYEHAYMGGEMDLELYLVGLDGTVSVIDEPAAETSQNNGRYGYGIPEGFDGYLFMPSSIFCDHGDWSTPIFTNDDPVFTAVGFDVNGDEPSFFLVTVHDMYICTQELPEIAPKSTEAPTEAPTEVPTEVPTAEPTEAPTDAPVVTEEPKTTDDSKSEEPAPKKNNGWLIPVIIGGVVVVAAIIVAVAAASKKKKKA